MSPRVPFRKQTPDGLSIDIEEYDGLPVLLLTKELPGAVDRAAQVMGIADKEVNTPTVAWYYEYRPLPKPSLMRPLAKWLENHGYRVGTFDQFGNFHGRGTGA